VNRKKRKIEKKFDDGQLLKVRSGRRYKRECGTRVAMGIQWRDGMTVLTWVKISNCQRMLYIRVMLGL